LKDEKLATVLDIQVAKHEEVKPDYRDKPRRMARGDYSFKYSFSFNNSSLFKSIRKLKHFDAKNFVDSDHRYYEDKFKLMIFVPVNDSKYAAKVSKELRATPDFAHFMDSETILLYFKPLPYRFQFKPLDEEGVVLIYVD